MERALNGSTVLLVHAGSLSKQFILERAKALGVRIICLNKKKEAFAEPFVDHWIFADLKDETSCFKKITEFIVAHADIKIDGVITFWDESVVLAAHISEQFCWIGILSKTADRIKNKYAFRDACQTEGIPAPHHLLLNTEADLAKADAELEYPVVVKPVYGASSAFVVRADNLSELTTVYNDQIKNIHTFWLAPEWNSLQVLVEEYIDGQEVDIDILVQNGEVKYISIIDNKETNEPFFVETGWSSPSRLGAKEQKELEAMAVFTLKALKVENGCVHFEAKYGSKGAVPIEINLRMGGGEVYLYSKLVWGVDLVENALKIALGLPVVIDKPDKPICHLLSYRFLPEKTCKLTKLRVDEAVYGQSSVVSLYFEKQVGDIFLAPPEGYDRCIGVITVKGESHVAAEENLAKALKYIKYAVEPLNHITI